VVQALPSKHGLVLSAWTQPVDGLHASLVHGLLSSQFGAGPPLHVPPPHVSPVVQALPSLQAFALLVCAQPWPGSHESSVHGLLSLQFGAGPPMQLPPPQVSFVVQALPSSQGFVLFVFTHPVAGTHASLVHGLLSLQSGAGPPLQVPPPQVSPVVQALPSLQGFVLLVCAHPVDGSQLSVVQPLLSLQSIVAPERQEPPSQMSPAVQAFPSSHGFVLFAFTHPVAGLHESVVHGLLSLQSGAGPPVHTPPAQTSFVVHAFWSLHALALLVCTHPLVGSHASSVQGLLSSQTGAGPPTHTPLPQVSPVVQAFPSLHDFVLLVWTHPVTGSHESSMQGLPLAQLTASPAVHDPATHDSLPLQALPSSQSASPSSIRPLQLLSRPSQISTPPVPAVNVACALTGSAFVA
jgi:hypothetical protein